MVARLSAAILAIVLVLASTVAGQEKGTTRALLARAEKGEAEAQFSLGLIYYDGQEEAQDYSEAVRWFSRAADQGHVAAQFNLGIMYSDGNGVAKDPVLAHLWFSLAALHADRDDKKKFAGARDWIARQMTPQQIAEAQRRAREWKCCTLAPVQSERAGPLRMTTVSETRQPDRACVGQVCIDGVALDIGPHSCYVKGKLHNGSTTTFEPIVLTFRLGREGASTGTATAIMQVPLGPGESWSFSALSLDPAAYTDSVTMDLAGCGKRVWST